MPSSLPPAIVFLGHGSRDPQWQRPFQNLLARCAARAPATLARVAFLEHTAPSLFEALADCARHGAREVRVVAVFIGHGTHLRQDLPRLIDEAHSKLAQAGLPALHITTAGFVGEWDPVLDAIVGGALQD